jgi:hypothetical protein
MASKPLTRAGALIVAAMALMALTPTAHAASSAQAVPPGCTLRVIDGGRTSEANCLPGSYTHFTQCQWGSNIVNISVRFSRYNTNHCSGNYRVSGHAIYRL